MGGNKRFHFRERLGKVEKMKTWFFCVLMTGSVLFPRCNRVKEPTPDAPTDPASVLAQCELACNRLAELGCEGWQGSPGYDGEYETEDDVPCVQVCTDFEINPESELNSGCIAVAPSCPAMEKCY